ncbi:MAG: hypothetical protein E6G97_08225 [Alphaproteobacteria bacterium]|nr:MAG: hypothetical protein E6G97_08225 [Alphaproteobacteria bacterium]
MVSSRWVRLAGLPLVAATLSIFVSSPGFAKVNQAGALLVPVTAAPKSCSGAFRYAARVGNSDIVTVSPLQVFAADRRLARTRYTSRAMAGFGPKHSLLLAANTMCG